MNFLSQAKKTSLIARIFSLSLLALFVIGCSSAKVPLINSTAKISVTVEASDNLNPDNSGRPSPVVLRIYELKSPLSFDNAEFFVLYDSDKEVIGVDILAVEEREVFPGEQFQIKRKLNEETTAIGLLAAYRNIDQSRWRSTIEVKSGKTVKGTVSVGANALGFVSK